MSTKIYFQFVLVLLILTSLAFAPTSAALAYQEQGVSSSPQPLSDAFRLEWTEKELVGLVARDVNKFWAGVFSRNDLRYKEPRVVYVSTSGMVKTACGSPHTAKGPFYCSLDNTVYFIQSDLWDAGLHSRIQEIGDFATALIVAHEISHHVQNQLGITSAVAEAQETLGNDQKTINALTALSELQADCYAGMWSYTAWARGMMEEGDIEEGLTILHHIGDDSLGATDPGDYTHGSARARMEWFLVGYDNGDMKRCNTFAATQNDTKPTTDPIKDFFVNASHKSCQVVDDGVKETIRTIRCVFKDNGRTFEVDYDEWSSERAWMNNLNEWNQSDDLVDGRTWKSSGTGGHKGPYVIVASENQTSTLLWGVSGTRLTGTIYWYDDDYDALKTWFLEYGNHHNVR